MYKFVMLKNGVVVNEVFQEAEFFQKVDGYNFPNDYDTVVFDYGDKFHVGDTYSIEEFNIRYPYHEYYGKTDEEIVKQKQAAISMSATALMASPMRWQQHEFGATDKDRANMVEKVIELKVITTDQETQDWITEANETITLGRDEFVAIARVIGKRRELITFLSRQMKDAAATLTGSTLLELSTDVVPVYLSVIGDRDSEFAFFAAM